MSSSNTTGTGKSAEELAALRAAARSAYQRKRGEETMRVHAAIQRETELSRARGIPVDAATLEAQRRRLAVAEDLQTFARANEQDLGGDAALAGLQGDVRDIAADRYAAAERKRGGDTDGDTHRQSRRDQPSAEDDGGAAGGGQKHGLDGMTSFIGGDAAAARDVNLIVSTAPDGDNANVGRTSGRHTNEPAAASAAPTSVMSAKRKVIELQRAGLPVTKARDEIMTAIKENQVVVIIGETGSGKTTQIPQFLHEGGYKKVACTQPRRLAAMSVAERVANEHGCRCGSTVGYNVRFDNKTTDKTEIEFVTDGMMLKTIMSDPDLSAYGAIMIDEAHERSLATDILLGFLRDLIRKRDDLKIIVASATIEAGKFANFFGKAPLVRVSGRTFPVDTMYLPEPEEDYVAAAATAVLQTHIDMPLPGDILVFLPGQEDIERCMTIINESIAAMAQGSVRPLSVLPVYSTLPPEEQKLIYAPTPKDSRKVVIATNIAETSITVDGIVYVIDTGLCKQKYFSSASNMESLSVVPISLASSEQRKGRAGRTRPGKCLRLYTKHMYENELDRDPPPEILRTGLTAILLSLKTLGIDNPLNFDFIDAPAPTSMVKALENLRLLGALTRRGQLTKTGRRMAELPIEPPIAKALLRAQEAHGCAKEACIAAAMLSLQNGVFVGAKDKAVVVEGLKREFFSNTTGDVAGYVHLFREWEERQRYSVAWCKANGVNGNALLRARDVRNQLLNTLANLYPGEELTTNRDPVTLGTAVTKALLSGLFTNVAKLSLDDRSFLVPKTKVEAFIHPSSVLSSLMFLDKRAFDEQQQKIRMGVPVPAAQMTPKYVNVVHGSKPQLVMFAELRKLKERAYMVHLSAIDPAWVREVAPDYYKDSDLVNTMEATTAAAAGVAASLP